MQQTTVTFSAAKTVTLVTTPLPPLAAGQVRVQTRVSAISAGTELLIYRGDAPQELAADSTIAALAGDLHFPLAYGYSAVGDVIAVGDGVDAGWHGRRVFAFVPHSNYFDAAPADLVPLPGDLDPAVAALLPNMETAVSFVMDGRPVIGERIAVFGQGIVGLLTTRLLADLSPAELVAVDAHANRRAAARDLGATRVYSPDDAALSDFDLVYELSGNPAALDVAIAATGYGGRVVIGSWYGRKPVELRLGGAFHRNQIALIGSQVSTLAPHWRGRWSKARRLQLALDLLCRHRPDGLITHRFAQAQAADAYDLLANRPGDAIQVVLTYPEPTEQPV